MKDTSDRIIYVALALAFALGAFSFFRIPAYEKGAWAVISLVVLVVTNVLSFKFGVHVAAPSTPNSLAAEPQKAEQTDEL